MKHSRDPYDFESNSMYFMHSSRFPSNPEPRKSSTKLKMKIVEHQEDIKDKQR